MKITNNILFKYLLYYQLGGDLSRIKLGEKRWNTFEHNGIIFEKPYKYKKLEIKINNKPNILSPDAEEACLLYAKYIESEYIKNKIFNKNFLYDLNKLLSKDQQIKTLEEIDFTSLYKFLIKEKEIKKELSKEEKQNIKDKKDILLKPFKLCLIDGKEVNVGNYMVEPVSLFLGRGCSPDMGKIKKRIKPSDVILNMSKNSKIPKCYYLDDNNDLIELKEQWGKIINDNTLVWLASYKDNITKKIKYVWTANDSHFKAESDQAKFEKARELKKRIKKIREINNEKLVSKEIKERQIGTALYLIDTLAIRVGTEKTDTDVVGCTTLEIQHIELKDNNNIRLSFLGKDSIPYDKEIQVIDIVYNNLKEFKMNKNKNDQIFDKITAIDLNKYLNDLMEGLSAKVFRTFNASILFEEELLKIDKKYEGKKIEQPDMIDNLLNEYIKANLNVAILCNHQKAVSKSFKNMVNNIDDKLNELKNKKKEYQEKGNNDKVEQIKKKIKLLESKKELKLATKNFAVETSRTNYIDPRITIAWLKRHNIDIDKVFSSTLIQKFNWSLQVNNDFRF
jgi:DNA topoisomerase-1